MSRSSWSYTTIAVVQPLEGHDDWTGAATYGSQYSIRCTWTAQAERRPETSAAGDEFVATHIIFTDDPRPAYLDRIKIGETWHTVRSIQSWDDSTFGGGRDYRLAVD